MADIPQSIGIADRMTRVFKVGTDEFVDCSSIDCKELVASGEYSYEPQTGLAKAAAKAEAKAEAAAEKAAAKPTARASKASVKAAAKAARAQKAAARAAEKAAAKSAAKAAKATKVPVVDESL